jgi:tRNA(Ile)-lysidine synthase
LLRAACLAWVEDPSNRNAAALRTRLRQRLDDRDGSGPQTAALAAHARASALRRTMAGRRIAAELAARATIHPEAYALLSPGPLSPAALAALIQALTGAPYAPSDAALARLAGMPRPATAGGVRLLPAGKLGPGLLLVREAAAMAPPIAAVQGALWDRRFLVRGTGGEPGTIGAVGPDAPSLRRYSHLPAAILQTLPALRVNGMLVEVPHIGYRPCCGSTRMAVSFAPATPASGAPFGSRHEGDAEPEVSPHLRG